MTAAHHNFASPSIRAQDLLNSHIASIDAALRHLRVRAPKIMKWRAEAMGDKLKAMRSALIHDLDAVLASPSVAKVYLGHWGNNGFAPNVAAACEAVDRERDRAEIMAAYRRSIMRLVPSAAIAAATGEAK